jgi:hypothetical protein
MGFFGTLLKAGGMAGKATLGGGARRVFTGAAIGGVVGGVTSENRTGTGVFSDVLRGATFGAGAGALTTGLFRKGMVGAAKGFTGVRGLPKHIKQAMPHLSWRERMSVYRQNLGGMFGRVPGSPMVRGSIGAGKLGIGAGKMAYRAGRWALRHPWGAAGLAGAGIGMAALAGSGAGASGLTEESMSAIATAHGYPSTGFAPGMGSTTRQDSRAMFMDSTFGLVQGMHAGRHR